MLSREILPAYSISIKEGIINPYMDFIGFCISNKLKGVITKLSIRDFYDMPDSERQKTIENLIGFCGMTDSVTASYNSECYSERGESTFFTVRISNDRYDIVKCKFSKNSKNVEGSECGAKYEDSYVCYMTFEDNPSLDYTGIERSKNYLDFCNGGDLESSLDCVFACLCGILDMDSFVKYHKTRCMKAKNITSFCNNRISSICPDCGMFYDYSSFTVYAIDDRKIYYRDISMDDYMKELVDFENKLKDIKNAYTD